ncbi:MAG: FAD-binding oxidoreductase, partial [Ancalomicrobiaceae bacterium]|nr:FAD-binding oxidoreductase [Ancalomicrobiaceae bacterium]
GDLLTTGPYGELATEQVRLPYFNFATEPLDEHAQASILPGRQGCWDTREVLSSFRFDASGRLVFGSVGALRFGGLEVHRAWAHRAIAKIFPQIAGVKFEAEWYGWIGMTDDAIPRFHRFADTVFSISGYNGRGISPGTTFGRLIAERILGRIGDEGIPLPLTQPKDASLRLFKQPYYEAGAQAFHVIDAWI